MKYIHLVIPLLIAFLLSCNKQQETEKEELPTLSQENLEKGKRIVNLTAEQVNMAGIKSGKVLQKNIASSIKANGIIDVPPKNIASIHALMDAFVKTVKVHEGEKVKKGQILAVLVHPEFIHLQENYLKALGQLSLASKNYERQKKLSTEQATALKKFQEAEERFITAKSETAGLRARIKMLGIDLSTLKTGKITEEIYMRAPFTGSISAVYIALGQHITPQDQAIAMVNKTHVHGELEVFARDILKISNGQKVKFTVNGSENIIFEGEVFLIGETVDQKSNTVNVHVHPKGDVSKLKLGMYISAEILQDTTLKQVVPELAVVKDEEKKYVFIDKGNFKYEMLPVETGIAQRGYLTVTGISNELNIVTEGANYLWATL